MATYQRYSQRLNAHLKAAKAYAELSYAKRLKVGAVLVKDDRIISVGYNGMPAGMDNVCEEPTGEVLTSTIPQTVMRTKPGVVHAETNAIAYAARAGVPTEGCIMVTTHSPCFECSKLIMQAGIKEIYYEEEYRLTDSLTFLKSNGIIVERVPTDGREEKSRPSTETRGPKTITPIQTHSSSNQNSRGSTPQLN